MSAYSSHLPFLVDIFNIVGNQNSILEFGMGMDSTLYLINKCNTLISIEMNSSEYFHKVSEKLSSNNKWTGIECLGALSFYNLNFPENIDFCFVDGHGDSRAECINLAMNKNIPIIVTHDTEWPGYRWERVQENNYYTCIYKQEVPWTTLYTTNKFLIDKLKEKYDRSCNLING